MPKGERRQKTSKARTEPYSISRRRKRKSFVMAQPPTVDIDEDTENQLLASDNESAHDNLTSTSSVNEMFKLLREIKQSQCTKDDLSTFATGVNTRLASVEGRIVAQDDNMSLMAKRIDECERATAATQYQMELDKQRQLKNNITLFGIPSGKDENITEIVLNVLAKIDCKTTSTKIVDCYRIKGNSNHIIVAKLRDFELKQKILSNKSKKKVVLRDIMPNSTRPNEPVFINNHTTPFFGKLLAEGRKAAKEGQINSCWLNTFGCQLKFSEEGKSYSYRDTDELHKLIAKHSEEGRPRSNKRTISPTTSDDNQRPNKKK